MRQPHNGKTDRKNISVTIGKKKSKRAPNHRNNCVKMEHLECINDALCFHRAYGLHGTWKLVPKDSCEVYKDQRRRHKNKSNGRVNKRLSRKGTGRKEPLERDRSMSDEENRYSREKLAQSKTKKTPKKKKRRNHSPKNPSSDESNTTYSDTSMSSAHSSDNAR